MKSKCCKAKPLFSIGYAHGVRLFDGKYYGVCSKCDEQAIFTQETKLEYIIKELKGIDQKQIDANPQYFQTRQFINRLVNRLEEAI